MDDYVNNLSHYQDNSRLHFIGSWRPKATDELKKWWSHYDFNNDFTCDSDVPEAQWMLSVFRAFSFGSSVNAIERLCQPFAGLSPLEALLGDKIELSINELKVFIHIDMDAFFCSVTLSKPEFSHLINEPVAVAAGKENSEISSCNYVARRYGVKAGMYVGDVRRRICRKLKIVPYDLSLCTAISIDVYRIIYESCPSVRVFYSLSDENPHDSIVAPVRFALDVVSIDDTVVTMAWPRDGEGRLCVLCGSEIPTIRAFKEWATGILYSTAIDFCQTVKRKIQTKTNGCTASFGIGSSYLISRLSTATAKPNGIACVLPPVIDISRLSNSEEKNFIFKENEFIDTTLVTDLFGVGSKTFEKLIECLLHHSIRDDINHCNSTNQRNMHKKIHVEKKRSQALLTVGIHGGREQALILQNYSNPEGNCHIAEERACLVIWNNKRAIEGMDAPPVVGEIKKKPGGDILMQLLKRKLELSNLVLQRKRTRTTLFSFHEEDSREKDEEGQIKYIIQYGGEEETVEALKSYFKCTHLQCIPLAVLQKALGGRKGSLLYFYCRGIDFRDIHSLATPVHHEVIMTSFECPEAIASKLLQITLFDSQLNSFSQVGIKTLSSSMNYACRPKSPKDVLSILSQLIDDTCGKARRVFNGHTSLCCQSVKVVFLERHPDAPKETPKYMGCGKCVEKTIMIKLFSGASDVDTFSLFSSLSVISRHVSKDNFLNCSVLASTKAETKESDQHSPLSFDAILKEDLLSTFQQTVTSLVMLACEESLVESHTGLPFSIIIDDIRGLNVSLCSLKGTDEPTEDQSKLIDVLRRKLFACQEMIQNNEPILVESQSSSNRENVSIIPESIYPSIDAALKHIHSINMGLDNLSAVIILLRQLTQRKPNSQDPVLDKIRDFICQEEGLSQLQICAKTAIFLKSFASSWVGSYDLDAAIARAFEVELYTLVMSLM